MRTFKLLGLASAALLALAGVAAALDAPHDGSFATSVTECQSCHKLHGTVGGTLLGGYEGIPYTSNNHACLLCHDSAQPSPNHLFTGGWSSGREAVPGTGGDQHKWSGSATSLGARVPLDPAMSVNVVGGEIQCAVCHDAHGVRNATGSIQATFAPGSVHSSFKLGIDEAPTGGGTGTLRLVAIIGAKPAGYRIRISTGGENGQFMLSHDYARATVAGTAVTWLGPYPYSTAADTTMPDDSAVKVRFGGTPTAGEEWQFYVSYPFLSTTNVGDAMCLDCHADRHQTAENVSGGGSIGVNPVVLGTTVFSHPVGETAAFTGAPDADGSNNDGNPTNDLKPVGSNGNRLGCTTCHAPHNADSNSLTVDVR